MLKWILIFMMVASIASAQQYEYRFGIPSPMFDNDSGCVVPHNVPPAYDSDLLTAHWKIRLQSGPYQILEDSAWVYRGDTTWVRYPTINTYWFAVVTEWWHSRVTKYHVPETEISGCHNTKGKIIWPRRIQQ